MMVKVPEKDQSSIVVDIEDDDDEISDVSEKFQHPRLSAHDLPPTSSPSRNTTTATAAAIPSSKILTSDEGPIHAARKPTWSSVINGRKSKRCRAEGEQSNLGGMSTTTTTMTTSSAVVTPKSSTLGVSLEGEQVLECLIQQAEYEIHQDAYRGILSNQQSLETKTKITTPWHACELGSLRPEPLEDMSDLDDPQKMLRNVANCACPSLKAWTKGLLMDRTKKNEKITSKKRLRTGPTANTCVEVPIQSTTFQVGVRPQGDAFVCPCDFNPLCLATLGGIVNQLLEERCGELDSYLDSPAKEGNDSSASETTPSPSLISKYFSKEKKTRPRWRPSTQNNYDDDDSVKVVETPSSENPVPPNTKIVNVDKVDERIKDVRTSTTDDNGDDESSDPFIFEGSKEVATITTQSPSRQRPLQEIPLLERLPDFPLGNPMDVFTQAQASQEHGNSIEFSSHTKEARQRCRASIQVATTFIESYVHQVLKVPLSEGEGYHSNDLTVEKYMDTVNEWHSQLLFVNPVVGAESPTGDTVTLSMPPGIRNLGATCYLNTQLQCLAQNVTFLNGIFSWRVVDETHRMNSVMSKMQHLLAQMFVGGDNKLTTMEFSNALGLEHDEQQDPNEFARLLFDRMDESFQQCDSDGDLSDLLKRIFHGVSTYETICLSCGHKSERKEGFMDLNLPIVKPPRQPKKKSGTIEEAFAMASSKDVDTNLQFCLEEYTCTEMLTGDNQYFCSVCNGKQDAQRILKLTELPPVLNIQLSRYVYDRTKFTKKKVCDKVLLPRSLDVTTQGSSKTYLLCAVMRHQGNSAYSGHYLAEAMDWTTGQWFEFNDEAVRLLPEGPSSSFNPKQPHDRGRDTDNGVDKGKGVSLKGSQDAYNMYYVEEDYLSKAAQAAAIHRQDIIRNRNSTRDVLDDISDLRKEQYKELSKLFLDDAKVSDRLSRRKLGIRNYLMPSIRSLVPADSSTDPHVWLSTKFLRQFLRCQPDDELDGLLKSCDPVIRNGDLLCPHRDGLTPRVAHQGKLVPLKMYDTLVGLLRGERAFLRQGLEDEGGGDKSEIEDFRVGSDNRLICERCCATHRDSLLAKLCRLRSLKALYDALDAGRGDVELVSDENQLVDSSEDRFVYAISRQSVVRFRKSISSLIKSLAKWDGGSDLDSKSPTSPSAFGGLSAIDSPSTDCDNDDISKTIDFNESITCPHGNLLVTNGRHVQYVSGEVWDRVKQLFPAYVEHKVERTLDFPPDRCHLCTAERKSVEQMRDAINGWAKGLKRDGPDFAKRELSLPDGCRLMHKSDISVWQEAVKVLSNLKRIRGDSIDAIRAFVEPLVFPRRHAVGNDCETAPIDKFGACLRSFVCRQHRMVVEDAILSHHVGSDGDTTRKLASYITVVNNVDYQAYLESIASLLCILRPEKSPTASEVGNSVGRAETKSLVEALTSISALQHPLIRLRQSSDNDSNGCFQISIDGSLKDLKLSPSLCSCKSCATECLPHLLTAKEKDDDFLENKGVGSPSDSKATENLGSGVMDPILVESDTEDHQKAGKYKLRVFELKEGSSEEETLKSLRDVAAIACDTDEPSEIRRSSRKRKRIYPMGALLSEETVDAFVDYNIAAICLLMFQSGIQIDFLNLVVVLHEPFEEPKIFRTTTSTKDLELTIPQILSRDEKEFDVTKHVTLLYERHKDQHDANATCVIDDLFSYSNIHDRGRATEGELRPKKKNRPSERGFRGTLLHGYQPATAPTSDCDNRNVEDNVDVVNDLVERSDDHQEGKDLHMESLSQAEVAVVVDDSTVVSALELSPSNPNREDSSDDDNSEDERILKMGPTFKQSPQKDHSPMDKGTSVIYTLTNTSEDKRSLNVAPAFSPSRLEHNGAIEKGTNAIDIPMNKISKTSPTVKPSQQKYKGAIGRATTIVEISTSMKNICEDELILTTGPTFRPGAGKSNGVPIKTEVIDISTSLDKVSEVEPIQKTSPSFKSSPQKQKEGAGHRGASVIEISTSTSKISGDERVLETGPTWRSSPQKRKRAIKNDTNVIDISTPTENDVDDGVLQKLMEALGEAVGVDDQERLAIAATIALSSDVKPPKRNFDALLAGAMEYYYRSP